MKVFLDYTQDELDAQYNQRSLVPDVSGYEAAWREGTEIARRTLRCSLGIAYGPRPCQRIDLFGVEEGGVRPVIVFIHGGAWRLLSLDDSGYVAPAFVSAGALAASIDFDHVPDVSLDVQFAQARSAIEWIIENVAAYGGDPQQVVLCGHSSGAHLAAAILTSGLKVAGAVLVSGSYDLEPVRLSARNSYLHLDAEAARRNSPLEHVRPGLPPVAIAYGTEELDEFRRQAKAFAAHWQGVAGNGQLIERRGLNHFEMASDFTEPDSPVYQAALRLLKLG